ncbi:HAD hydrolase-like protein [Frankia sp. QA3]|uniref:HAD family hydrolase n=1 Tax=Frankia sp. QA3 TaxID=710111 RepID=UPI0018DED197
MWHVGDSPSADVAGANALGIPAVWVNRKGRRRPAGASVAAEVIDLASIGELIRSASCPA